MKTTQLTKQKGFIYKEINFPNPDIQYIWKLDTLGVDNQDVEYKIIPDASIDIVFERYENYIFNPVISAPFSTITKIRLAKDSKYLGIRFNPGKFRKYIDIDPNDITGDFVDFQNREYDSVNHFFDSLKPNQKNPLSIFDNNLKNLLLSSLSQRQKRRIFKSTTGFTIRDFNKIITFQNSLNNNSIDKYFDQSHKIKTYQSLVQMTPSEIKKYL